MEKPTIININGDFVDPQSPQIQVFDRGYMYGDSLYEVVRTYNGQLFGLNEHLGRLQRSSELARMKLDQSLQTYEKEMKLALARFYQLPGTEHPDGRPVEAYCRLIISRGIGRVGFGLDNLTSPSLFTIIVQSATDFSEEQINRGMHLRVSPRIRVNPKALDPAMKSGNYLNCLLATLEAHEKGFDDAILCNAEGFLTEGTTFNLFYIRNGIVATPPLEIGILWGITREIVRESCHALGLPVREVYFKPEQLYAADEVFITGTIKEVFPVTKVDQVVYSKGKPGRLTRMIRQEFRKRVYARLEKGGPESENHSDASNKRIAHAET